jgi:hypothetical protein
MYSMAIDVDSFAKTLLQDDLVGDFAPVLASVATKKEKRFCNPRETGLQLENRYRTG